jgi:hypothetical protein
LVRKFYASLLYHGDQRYESCGKVRLTNTIDAEPQITPYEFVVAQSAASTSHISGVRDTFARLKINVLGDDHCAVAVALLPYVKLPTAQSGLGKRCVEGGLIVCYHRSGRRREA